MVTFYTTLLKTESNPNKHNNTQMMKTKLLVILSATLALNSWAQVQHIACGNNHSLLVTNGEVKSCGYNFYYQIGNSNNINQASFVNTLNLANVSKVAGGGNFSMALSNGYVWTWGNNSYGQLGDNTTTTRKVPVQVTNLNNVTAISAGQSFGMALTSDGTVHAWGRNEHYQLGIFSGSTTARTPQYVVRFAGPDTLIPISNIVSIAAGDAFGLAVDSTGQVWSWGSYNGAGIWGTGGDIPSATLSYYQYGNITNVAAGGNHSLLLSSSGVVYSWGDNTYGQLGSSNGVVISNIVKIAAGANHSLALDSGGQVWAWGLNDYGQLGDGTTINRSVPVQTTLSNVVDIAAGTKHSMAKLNDGRVVGVGQLQYGQLGVGIFHYLTTPGEVEFSP